MMGSVRMMGFGTDDGIGTDGGICTDDGISTDDEIGTIGMEVATEEVATEVTTDVVIDGMGPGFVNEVGIIWNTEVLLTVAAGMVIVAWLLLGRLTVMMPEEV